MNENQPRRHLITPIVVFGITALIAVVMLLWALVIWLAQLTGSMIWATLILGGVWFPLASLNAQKYLTDKCLNVQKSPYTERGYLPTTQEIVLHMVDFRLQIFRQVNRKDTRQRIIIWKS